MAAPLVTRETLVGPSVSYDPVCFQSFTDLSCFGVTSVLSTLSVSTDDVEYNDDVLGFACQQQVLKTFPGLGSVRLVIWGDILMRVTSVVVGTVPYALGKSYY
ncbi:MAG: hypothetical protein GY938_18100 [Ketobacter sp.]|nr:hypothetical protein [Ketobacter sp.]